MMDDSGVDSRGVRRGQCTQCACIGYNGGVHKKKCENSDCGHPPGKHVNMSNPSQSAMIHSSLAIATDAGHSAAAALPGQLETHHNMGNVHQGHIDALVHGVDPSQLLSHHHHQPQSLAFPGGLGLVDLPICKAEGCKNRVHFEYFLPPPMQTFDYCSPVCRDRHLLEIHKEQLKYDLETLYKDLQHSVLAEKTSQDPALMYHNQSQQSNPVFSFPPESLVDVGDSKVSCSTSVDPKLYKMVEWKKVSEGNFGAIVCMNMFHSEKEISGFLITGVQKGSEAYKMMQNSQLCLLDIVESIDSTRCKDLGNVANTQKSFDDLLQHCKGKFCLYRSESLGPKICTKLISAVKGTDASHIFVMMPQFSKEFGLKIKSKSNSVVVAEACVGSPAYLCGVRCGDTIRALATTKNGYTQEINWDSRSLLSVCRRNSKNICEDIKQALVVAHKSSEAVILDILRSGKTKK